MTLSHKKLASLFFLSGSIATGYWADYSAERILYTALINQGVTFKLGGLLGLSLPSYHQIYQIREEATPHRCILTKSVRVRRLQYFNVRFLLQESDFKILY